MSARPTDGPGRVVRAALVALTVLPIAVAVVRALVQRWFPIGDSALLYVRVRDVGTAHHPLLGSWTSASLSVGEDMNNPGPLYDDLLAPVAHLFSAASTAALGVGLVNAAAVVGASTAGRHIGGWPMQRWVLAACALLSWSMGSEMLIDLWQPHALLLPLLCLLVLATGVSVGRTRCIPWALFVASVIVQTHLGYAYIVACLTVITAALAWWRARPLDPTRWRELLQSRILRWSLAVLAVSWSQTLIEQCFGAGRGNLTRLASSVGKGDLQIGPRDAVRLAARVVAQPPWSLRSDFATRIPTTNVTPTADGPRLFVNGIPGVAVAGLQLAAVVAVLVVLARLHHRRGNRLLVHACALSAAGIVASVLCFAVLIVGTVGLAQHHLRWLWALTVFAHVSIAWGVVELAAERWRTVRVRLDVVLAAVVAVLSIANLPFLAQQQGPVVDSAAMPALRRVFRQLDVLADSAPVVFDVSNVRVFEPYSSAVMMRLQELGIEFRVESEGMVRQLGNRRRASGDEQTTIFQLEALDVHSYDGPACRIAMASALTEEDEDAAAAAAATVSRMLVDGELTVDRSGLGDDHDARLAAVLAGDGDAARRLVEDGAVGDWLQRGLITGPADVVAALPDDLALIGRWVFTTYAVYALDPVTCP